MQQYLSFTTGGVEKLLIVQLPLFIMFSNIFNNDASSHRISIFIGTLSKSSEKSSQLLGKSVL